MNEDRFVDMLLAEHMSWDAFRSGHGGNWKRIEQPDNEAFVVILKDVFVTNFDMFLAKDDILAFEYQYNFGNISSLKTTYKDGSFKVYKYEP